MNRARCEEVISAFKERASYYQAIQQERDLTVAELGGMKKEYLNFTKGLLQALNEQEKQDIDLDGVKRIFRNSGLKKEELSDGELDELIMTASSDTNYGGKVIDVRATVNGVPNETRRESRRKGLSHYFLNAASYAAMLLVGMGVGCQYSLPTKAERAFTKDKLISIESYVKDNNSGIDALRGDMRSVAQIGDFLDLRQKYDDALATIKDKTKDMEDLAQKIQELGEQYQSAQRTNEEKDGQLQEQQRKLAELGKIRTEYLRKVLGVKEDIESIVQNLEDGVEKLTVKSGELKP